MKWEWLGGKDGDTQLRDVRRFFTRSPHARYPAVGFKTKLGDVKDREGFARLLRAIGVRIIAMQRRNSIKQVVSRVNAERINDATGYWNLWTEEDRLPPATIDVVEFSRRLQRLEDEKRRLESYVRSLDLPTLWLDYEDLLAYQRAIFERAFSFLGVQFEPVQGRSIKNTSDDLREAVSNFDELRSHYIGTPYEQMFDEVLVSAQ
jgi:LPS sulfotransferase NodH